MATDRDYMAEGPVKAVADAPLKEGVDPKPEDDLAGGTIGRTRHHLPSIRDGRPAPIHLEYDAADDPFLLPCG